MKKNIFYIILIIVLVLILIGCMRQNKLKEEVIVLRLATTTSIADSGLLDYILPEFEVKNNIKVKIIAVGTGQALEIGRRGDADVLLVHAKTQEEEFVTNGYGTKRFDVFYNDFIIVGPNNDPAKLKEAYNAKDAIERLLAFGREKGVLFMSRGDNSGTHAKEKSLWGLAEVNPPEQEEWYKSLGQGMGETLITTNEMLGYTIADRGTYLSMKDSLKNIGIVFEGDDILFNQYGIIIVNSEKHRGIKIKEAQLLCNYFISDDIQKKIGEFGIDKFGQPLFFPNAN